MVLQSIENGGKIHFVTMLTTLLDASMMVETVADKLGNGTNTVLSALVWINWVLNAGVSIELFVD